MLPKRQIVQTFSKYSYEINLKILGEIFFVCSKDFLEKLTLDLEVQVTEI